MRCLVGIHAGGSAVGALLYGPELRPIARAYRPVAIVCPHDGWFEQDPRAVLDAVVETVAEVLAHAPGPVVGCGLAHDGPAVLAWDAITREPLTPVLASADRRAEALLAAMDPIAVPERSGLPLIPHYPAGKLAWLLRHDQRTAAARDAGTLRLGTLDAFLSDRLGGGSATEPSTVSRTQLGRDDWDPLLCEAFDVPVNALPRIRESAGHLATLTHPRWAVALPLGAQVIAGSAALAGAGCVTPGAALAAFGAGVDVLVPGGETLPDGPPGVMPAIAWRTDGRTTWALDGPVFTAAALLDWMIGELGLAGDVAALGRLAEAVPDAGGVRVLSALRGTGAPLWRDAHGVIAGLTATTTPGHIARAALDAIAWQVADVIDAVRPRIEVERLVVDGRLTDMPLLAALLADHVGVEVQRGAADAVLTGAAALAAIGLGAWDGGVAAIADRVPAPRLAARPMVGEADRVAAHASWHAFARLAAAVGALS